jgi:hypothetical protein
MIEKLLMWILTPLINREVRKIKNDPEIKAAEAKVSEAVDQYLATAKRASENMKAEEKREQEEFEERRKSWTSHGEKEIKKS